MSKLAKCFGSAALASLVVSATAAELPEGAAAFIDRHCASCHDDVEKETGLDLTTVVIRLKTAADAKGRISVKAIPGGM